MATRYRIPCFTWVTLLAPCLNGNGALGPGDSASIVGPGYVERLGTRAETGEPILMFRTENPHERYGASAPDGAVFCLDAKEVASWPAYEGRTLPFFDLERNG